MIDGSGEDRDLSVLVVSAAGSPEAGSDLWEPVRLIDRASDPLVPLTEPATLRYRLLHVAAHITRGQRRPFVRIENAWPWRRQLAAAFARLHALPQPTTIRALLNDRG